MANILDMDEKEETGLLSSALGALDAPRQFLLEKVIEGQTGQDVKRGNLNFGDVVENFVGPEFMANNPRTYAAISTIGDLFVDPLNLPVFGAVKGGVKGMAGMLGYATKQAKSPNLADIALTQDITRKAKGFEQNHPRSINIPGVVDAEIPDWYSGGVGRAAHLLNGVARTLKDFGEMAINPKAGAVFAKYGISPSNARDMSKIVDALNDPEALKTHYNLLGLLKSKSDEAVSPTDRQTLMNELHSQLAYTSSVLRKYIPDDKRREAFEESLGAYLFPKQRVGTVEQFKNDPKMIREVLNLPENITDSAILNHISARVPKGFGRELSGNIAVNSKPYQPSAPLAASTGIIKNKTYSDFLDVLKMYADTDIPINMKTLRSMAEEHIGKMKSLSKPKKKERLEKFMSALKDSDGYISMQGERLIQDRLLAHVNQITMAKKGKPGQKQGGFTLMYDQMKQGSGSELVESAFDVGSKTNFIAVDVVPFRPITETSKKKGKFKKLYYGEDANVSSQSVRPAVTQTPDPSAKVLSPERMESLTGETASLINYDPSMMEYAAQIYDRAADVNNLQKMGWFEDDN